MSKLYLTPFGQALTVVTCSKTVVVQGRRTPATRWLDQLPMIDQWVVAVYSESKLSLWLHSALSGMLGSPSTGGLIHNLNRVRTANVFYEAQWDGSGLKVALCDQNPALEGGLAKLIESERLFRRGSIPIPPAIAAMREIWTAFPEVNAILLPASPMESNAMRLALAHVLLVRPGALARAETRRVLTPPTLPHRLLLQLLGLTAPDRMSSLEDPPGRKLWAAPRLGFFLVKRRVAQIKDWARRVFLENPKAACASVWALLADPPDSTIELLRAIGYVTGSLLQGWAAILLALAVLIGALSHAGLL